MMKKLLPALLFSAVQLQLCIAQVFPNYCSSARYDTEVFPNVTVAGNINYGSNISVSGSNTNLTMDIYQPAGDLDSLRPLIIWAHGGSFVYGTKNDVDVVSLSNHFAKRGYVCASINYRLGIPFPPDQAGATKAVFRAVQDLKAAIRFFRKNAATTNTYKINPEMIFAGGSSAGAFMALHLAYMDQPSELPTLLDTIALGGLEGNSGNPGYSSQVNAIINLCGALGDTSWMHPGDNPVCSMHGTNDDVVPYATTMLSIFGYQIMVVNGSYTISQRANSIGIPNVMYTYFGAPHVPYVNNDAYMDTTVRFVSNFLYSYLACTPVDPSPLPNTFITTATTEISSMKNEIRIFPNPSSENIHIRLNSSIENKCAFSLVDFTGKTVYQSAGYFADEAVVERKNLPPGIYLLRIIVNGKESATKICFQ